MNPRYKRLGWIVIALVAVLLLLASDSAAQIRIHPRENPSVAYYFDDSGVAGWGQTGFPPHWEWMDAGPLSGTLPYYDLDPANPYYACSPVQSGDFSGYFFWAEIWLANNYANSQNLVTVELRRGTWGTPGAVLASASAVVTNQMPGGQLYYFDFSEIAGLVLDNESFIFSIVYSGPAGDTHIYWDQDAYPSALRWGRLVSVTGKVWGAIKQLYR